MLTSLVLLNEQKQTLSGNTLTIRTTVLRERGGIAMHEQTVPLPLPSLTKLWGMPTAQKLKCFSYGCHAVSAALLVGGLVTISGVANASLPVNVKAGVCAVGGLAMLSTLCCCWLSSAYDNASQTISQTTDPKNPACWWWEQGHVKFKIKDPDTESVPLARIHSEDIEADPPDPLDALV